MISEDVPERSPYPPELNLCGGSGYDRTPNRAMECGEEPTANSQENQDWYVPVTPKRDV